MPRRNRTAWQAKIEGNKMRDRLVLRTLRKQGYATLVLWECQTRDPKRLQKRLVSFFSQHAAAQRIHAALHEPFDKHYHQLDNLMPISIMAKYFYVTRETLTHEF
jgi:hypothetical protein